MPVCLKDKACRNKAYNELIKIGIKGRKYFYPLTVDFKYFSNSVDKNDLKVAYEIADRILCLPIYAGLKMSSIKKITALLNAI